MIADSPGRALDIGDWGSRREADWRLEIGPGRLEIGLWAPGVFFYSRRGVADRRRGFREELLDDMQLLEYRSVRSWSKEINGTLTEPEGRKE